LLDFNDSYEEKLSLKEKHSLVCPRNYTGSDIYYFVLITQDLGIVLVTFLDNEIATGLPAGWLVPVYYYLFGGPTTLSLQPGG